MAKEIERKYLVKSEEYKLMARTKINITQGYLCRRKESTVRVRVTDDKAFLTIKGKNSGAVRDEWEYEIPVADALQLIDKCCEGNIVAKTRYLVDYRGYTWEVDEFHQPIPDMIVAEVELNDEHSLPPLPSFIGDEVTGNPRYYNSNL